MKLHKIVLLLVVKLKSEPRVIVYVFPDAAEGHDGTAPRCAAPVSVTVALHVAEVAFVTPSTDIVSTSVVDVPSAENFADTSEGVIGTSNGAGTIKPAVVLTEFAAMLNLWSAWNRNQGLLHCTPYWT